jgi:hypothetical protein
MMHWMIHTQSQIWVSLMKPEMMVLRINTYRKAQRLQQQQPSPPKFTEEHRESNLFCRGSFLHGGKSSPLSQDMHDASSLNKVRIRCKCLTHHKLRSL